MSNAPLAVPELKTAEIEIVKYIQRLHFGVELDALMKMPSLSVKKSSSIYRLDPIINADGVLCVGGRLHAAPISEEAKHQMIIPKGCHVVTLIVRHYHQKLGHSGREHVLCHVHQGFWIIEAHVAINKVLRNCVHCKCRLGVPDGQRMADLPRDRVTPGKPPFTYPGCDCFGHFLVKRGQIMIKRYGCLFTCLTTRAIHIEKVDTMDTDSFINALKRFVCRRGQPARIRSGNGSNFRYGEKELYEAIQSWNQKQIHDHLLRHEIELEFNPPTASHMGRVWERQIRTVRKILTALLEYETLAYECLNTVFCEVESVVNSRPITPVSGDPFDAEPLTPNHLPLLWSGPEMLSDNFCKANIYRRRWKCVQFIADVFWKHWLMEYLPTLQLRQKWLKEKQNFREGDVVLIMDYSTPRKVWPLGKITRTFPGQDGLVRAAKVKSKGLLLRRPVHKLCMLESVND